MRQIHDRVSLMVEFPVLTQGTGPRTALLDEFRKTPNCVLFATSSFCRGGCAGEQLSCVIIDKLPFAVPSDPVVEARVRNVREAAESVLRLSDSAGAISLKQGFGRLDPHARGPGVLALLDHRITKQRYGRSFSIVCRITRFPWISPK